ncbi:MAG: hypothetical protein E7465_08310 [Ruminococcaceae bacterium]|nr:hypothetical protein [Oscillospiraceae bacterium]
MVYQGFYYLEQYMLLPEGFESFDAFMDDLKSRELPARYETLVLVENHHARNHSVIKGQSMAPYFLSGYHDDLSTIQITYPDQVYPVQVELIDQAEYNTRLRALINKYCPGCIKFKPLSNRVQSLNGHFEELPLDCTCLFREEIKPSRREMHSMLFGLGGSLNREKSRDQTKEDYLYILTLYLYLRYERAELTRENDTKYLTVTCKKKELLPPLLTNALETYTSSVTADACIIRPAVPFSCTEDTIHSLLSVKSQELYRKECKKYGVSLGCLEFDSAAQEELKESLSELVKRYWLFPLVEQSGKIWYLVTDHSHVLKELRYRSPLLQAKNATFTEYDQYDNLRYEISFLMKRTQVPNFA